MNKKETTDKKCASLQGKEFEFPFDEAAAPPKFQSRKSSFPVESTNNNSLAAVIKSEKNQKDDELAKWDDLI